MKQTKTYTAGAYMTYRGRFEIRAGSKAEAERKAEQHLWNEEADGITKIKGQDGAVTMISKTS